MEKLLTGAEALGLRLTEAQVNSFATYYQELKEWNERVNLTAIIDLEGVQVKHFVDSLSIIKSKFIADELRPWCSHAFREDSAAEKPIATSAETKNNTPPSLLDVGTGAGFPGIPIRILCPEINLTILESIGKKTAFLAYVVQTLNLQNVTILTGRAEEFGRKQRYRESFDIVTARAVAMLSTLSEYALPFCRVGGFFIAFKKAGITDEVKSAQRAIEILGGELMDQVEVKFPGLDEERLLIVIKKVSPTPIKYPRRPDLPSKHPI